MKYMEVIELMQVLSDGKSRYRFIQVWFRYGEGRGDIAAVEVTSSQLISIFSSMIPGTQIACNITDGNIEVGITR